MANKMGLDRAPIEFQTFYFSHVLVVPPSVDPKRCPFVFIEHFLYKNSNSDMRQKRKNDNRVKFDDVFEAMCDLNQQKLIHFMCLQASHDQNNPHKERQIDLFKVYLWTLLKKTYR